METRKPSGIENTVIFNYILYRVERYVTCTCSESDPCTAVFIHDDDCAITIKTKELYNKLHEEFEMLETEAKYDTEEDTKEYCPICDAECDTYLDESGMWAIKCKNHDSCLYQIYADRKHKLKELHDQLVDQALYYKTLCQKEKETEEEAKLAPCPICKSECNLYVDAAKNHVIECMEKPKYGLLKNPPCPYRIFETSREKVIEFHKLLTKHEKAYDK